MTTIKPIPYSEIITFFGAPGGFTDFVKTPFPFTLYLNGDRQLPCRNFFGHKYIANAVIDAFEEILSLYGLDYIQENGLDEYGGCYAYRQGRGTNRLSVHAWGLALDYLPSLGKLGEPPTIPDGIVRIFTKRGFIWGGTWTRPDGMHFTSIEE